MFILGIISMGYKIPLISEPPRAFFSNNRSAVRNSEFVKAEIESLLRKRLIRKCSRPPKVVNPLTVSTNSEGKCRLILDLKFVNLYLFKFPVRYEDISTVKNFLLPN